MGAHTSSPRELETKLLRTQDELKYTLKEKKSKKNLLASLKFVRRFFYFLFIIELIVIFIMRRRIAIEKTLYLVGEREFPIFLLFIAVFRYLLPSFIERRINALTEESLELKYKLEKYFHEYQSSPRFQKVKKALEKNGEYFEVDFDQILNLEYYTDADSTNGQGLFARILSTITQTGPDYRYAVICPLCHSHNGTVDESQRDTLKYKCKYCGALVAMNEVIQMPQKEETVHETKVDDQKQIEQLEESDDEELNDLK